MPEQSPEPVNSDWPVPVDFAARVVAWQRRHGRHGLPWQNTHDAYRIWLSEIMLQQTQVSTVLRYYNDFLQRFPDVHALARAAQDEVLAAWSGLGYYSRARNLHRCAQAVVAQHGGVFPTQSAVLQSLPGIGRSTAAAIAAFSAAERSAILDGNVKRVLARHRAIADDLARPQAMNRLWTLAEALLPPHDIRPYTQGLMDLGATVCTPRRPQCAVCPVQADCQGHAHGQVLAYPVKTRRTVRKRREFVVGLWCVGHSGPGQPRPGAAALQVLMQRQSEAGIWAGLWSLPGWADAAAHEADVRACAAPILPNARAEPVVQSMLTIEHALTHLDLVMAVHQVLWHDAAPESIALPASTLQQGQSAPMAWMGLDSALSLGLPAPVRRLLERLQAEMLSPARV